MESSQGRRKGQNGNRLPNGLVLPRSLVRRHLSRRQAPPTSRTTSWTCFLENTLTLQHAGHRVRGDSLPFGPGDSPSDRVDQRLATVFPMVI